MPEGELTSFPSSRKQFAYNYKRATHSTRYFRQFTTLREE